MIEIMLATILFLDANGAETVPAVPPPPSRYDYPFPGRLYAVWMPSSQIRTYCPIYGVACVIRTTPDECYIAINREYHEYRHAILRHENGHCNGWKH